MHARAALFKAADELKEMIERQIRMQSAHDVKFRCAFADALLGAVVDLFKSERVGAGSVGIAAEGAQLAMCDADVRRIDVAVDVVIGDVPVALLADVVCEPADGQQIRRAIQHDAVVHRQPLTIENLIGDWLEPYVSNRKFAHSRSVKKFKRAKPQLRRPRTTVTIN